MGIIPKGKCTFPKLFALTVTHLVYVEAQALLYSNRRRSFRQLCAQAQKENRIDGGDCGLRTASRQQKFEISSKTSESEAQIGRGQEFSGSRETGVRYENKCPPRRRRQDATNCP
jgi:hypothetical protein